MKKSLISKFLLGVMSLSMFFSVVGNNTAKAGGLNVLDSLNSLDDLYDSQDLCGFCIYNDWLIKQSERVFKDPDISSDEVVKIIKNAFYAFYYGDDNLIFVILKKCFERFPNLINVGDIDEYGFCMTALYLAVTRNNVEMTNWLLDHGAVWVVKKRSGEYVNDGAAMYRNVVRKAEETGQNDMLDCLLKHGYDWYCARKPMDPAQINPLAVAKPEPKSKPGLKARFRKMLGCFRSK